MKHLPNELKSLILDYYWSHKTYIRKRRIHCELLLAFTMLDIRGLIQFRLIGF